MKKSEGFILLAVSLTMSLLAVVAYVLNRENGMQASRDNLAMDADRARYAAEAGLQALMAKIQTADCNVSGVSTTITNSSFAGASYQATSTFAPISGNIVNPGTLVSTGTFNGTSVKLTRNTVYAYKNSTKSYPLQPNATDGIDTYLVSGSAANFGVDDLMRISNSRTALVKFDLPAVFPAGAIPETSRQSSGAVDKPTTLSMREDGSGYVSAASSVYRMNSSWTETGANWFTSNGSAGWTAGGNFHPTFIAKLPFLVAADDWLDFDLTQTAFAWMTGRYANNGIRVATVPGIFSTIDLSLSDSSTGSKRPKMDFNYLQPCGTNGPG